MEEGPEPHEWVEKAAEHKHHEHEGGEEPEEKRREMTVSAITAAVLAVLAAFGSLLSGHAANEAILFQTRASDQWAYFQAKSTKGHLYEVSKEVLRSQAEVQGGTQSEKIAPVLDRFQKQIEKYDREKEEVKNEAEHLVEESRHELHKHHYFALGIASFQVGIVLASVSIMIRYRILFFLSLVAGLVGVIFLLTGLVV